MGGIPQFWESGKTMELLGIRKWFHHKDFKWARNGYRSR